MKGFLAGGAAERPWHQLLIELAVAEDQNKVLHPADINRLVVRVLPSLLIFPRDFVRDCNLHLASDTT
jgi:hypothetical protein